MIDPPARILTAGRNVWQERSVRSVGLLVDGDDYYRAFYQAALRARRYIVLAGWQFDSEACLLRGPDAEKAELPVTMKAFLDALCDRTPELHIRILAWDFHTVFALEREWMQQLVFNWSTNERFEFRFDNTHVDSGCHHQKFVVIDGHTSFLGGLDLCDHRWDTRSHRDPDALRTSRGKPHKPFHDVQSRIVGSEIAADLVALFDCRWEGAGGGKIDFPPPLVAENVPAPEGLIELATETLALSRTDPHSAPTKGPACRELCDLHLDAIRAARHLIYAETQYFSAQEIGAALAARLASKDEPPLEVVLVLNMEAETLKEEIAVGLAQAKVLRDLRKAVERTQNRLGIYYTVPAVEGSEEPERATYIHSKLMIVDDRFITIGSANLTNRSASVDTELNASVEADSAESTLGRSIARARLGLLAEHLGVDELPATLDPKSGLVAWLDDRAARREGRLRLHPSPTEKEISVLEVIDPAGIPFDPAALEGQERDRSIFVGGIGALWSRLVGSEHREPARG